MLWLLLLVFYQVFVDSGYRRISLSRFVHAFTSLKYEASELGTPLASIDPLLIKVDCRDFCQFKLKDKTIPARVEIDPNGRLSDLTLQFFDSDKNLIGYQDKAPEPTFYVIDGRGELIQLIRLKLNHQTDLIFKAYYPSTQQMQFAGSDGKQWLYSATKPDLQRL